jgi:hypothetical protein
LLQFKPCLSFENSLPAYTKNTHNEIENKVQHGNYQASGKQVVQNFAVHSVVFYK